MSHPTTPVGAPTPAALHAHLFAWHRAVANHDSMPKSVMDALLAALAQQPDAWVTWRQSPGFPDEMIANVWAEGVMGRYYETKNASAMVRMAGSWQQHRTLLAACPLLGTVAIDLLVDVIGGPARDLKRRRVFQTRLLAIMKAAPRPGPVRYSVAAIEEMIAATSRSPAASVPFIAQISRDLGLSPDVVRSVWPSVDASTPAQCRKNLALRLTGAPVAETPAPVLAGRAGEMDPTAATPWGFYREIVGPCLETDLFNSSGEKDVTWAWGHPAWRAALLAHVPEIVLGIGAWTSRRQVQEALETMADRRDPWPVERRDGIVEWLEEVIDHAPLDLWSRVAAGVAQITVEPADAKRLWAPLAAAMTARPREVLGTEGWMPWLKAADGQVRAEAILRRMTAPAATTGEPRTPRRRSPGRTSTRPR